MLTINLYLQYLASLSIFAVNLDLIIYSMTIIIVTVALIHFSRQRLSRALQDLANAATLGYVGHYFNSIRSNSGSDSDDNNKDKSAEDKKDVNKNISNDNSNNNKSNNNNSNNSTTK